MCWLSPALGWGGDPTGRICGTDVCQGWLSSLVGLLKEHGLSITMEGAKRYSLAIPPNAKALKVEEMQGIISLTCEDPVQRRYRSA